MQGRKGNIEMARLPKLVKIINCSHRRMIRILRFCPLSRYFSVSRAKVLEKLPKKMDLQMELFLLNKVWYSRKKLPEIKERQSEYDDS